MHAFNIELISGLTRSYTCKYCRSVLNSKVKMYKGLGVWLNMDYQDGKPVVFQLQSVIEEDALLHPPTEFVPHNSPTYAPLVNVTDDEGLQLSHQVE